MKKTTFILAVFAVISLSAQSQLSDSIQISTHPYGEHFGKIIKDLNLTPTQEGKIKTIFEDTRNQMDAIRSDKSLSEKKQKNKEKDLLKLRQKNIEKILTSDQKEIWKTDIEDLKNKGQHGNGHTAGGIDLITRELIPLNLDSMQMRAILMVKKATDTQIDSIKVNDQFTGQQKRDKIEELNQQLKNCIVAILTPEQKTTWDKEEEYIQKMKDNAQKNGGYNYGGQHGRGAGGFSGAGMSQRM